jgi:dTDP-4-dehydro-6-deoxy-alpha-D-glucopyranose 2,3-dehydratase
MSEFLNWFDSRKSANSFSVEQIPFSKFDKWKFEEGTSNLVHDSGKFFTIRGIRVSSNKGNWEQPIIDQPEIGILGIVTKKFDGVRYFLMQAKMEPGNINLLQLSPTLQATKSNYTQAHEGKKPAYLDYFIDRSKSKILVDQLQTEHGGRFLRKRNRNIIVEVEEDINIQDDFKWLTLGELKQLMEKDNFVNMDARSILSCIDYIDVENSILIDKIGNEFKRDFYDSIISEDAESSLDEIIHWFTEMKTRAELKVDNISLKDVSKWDIGEQDIKHNSGEFFKIIGVNVGAGNREVMNWTQPLIKHNSYGLVGFLVKKINGTLHFLVQAKMDPGSFSIVEMAPTVGCVDAEERLKKGNVKFLDSFMNAPSGKIKYSCFQSDEGGRFYKSENKCMVVEANENLEISDNYRWMTLRQIMGLIKHNYLNIDARGLITYLNFV